ncbi:glycosyltransferase family 2 protein [Flavobacterium frigoris]|uniref:B-glycosyltransferase, glycosyltransferase family 2 protein n=1 Tax=Flavobacterium frigoris (strain PS1) TaxID=1086011 RepID=H7FMM5_FLAFP|nr:glycosyltransferase family 2 protein [Flavobacterium frigoris]EIA10237.1 B-glycosyltransferase, glycosyltransferase family 2 protein [Flavobacterium frigoris PS1]
MKDSASPDLKLPLISIVTVVYNDVTNIENTIESVINQTYSNIDYITIDGGSSDGTVDIINKYKHKIATIISGKDKGIYDAMNKGTDLAKGAWIIYMNSGDLFSDSTILEKIFIEKQKSLEGISVIYSDVLSKNKQIIKRLSARRLRLIWMGPPSSHQCQFVKTELAKSKPFNLNFRINADYDFIYYTLNKGVKFLYLKEFCIAICDASEGFSKTSDSKFILKENFIVSKQYSSFLEQQLLVIVNTLKYLYSIVRKFK